MAKKPAKYNSRQLTDHLRELAAEVETIDDEGAVITKGEALARLLFKKALGYAAVDPDDPKKRTRYFKPESWAIQLIWERLEGRTPMAIPEEQTRLTTAEQVSEIARLRLNRQAETAAAVSGHPSAVEGLGDGAAGPEGPSEEPPVADHPSG